MESDGGAFWSSAAAGLLALVVSVVLPVIVRPMLMRLNVIDIPSSRSSHTSPVVRGGGLSVLIALLAGLVAVVIVSGDPAALALVPLVALMGALGWVEDRRGLSVRARMLGQAVIGAAGASLIGYLFGAPPLLWLAGALGAVVYVNVSNFMDGVNGMSSLQGLVSGTAFALLGVLTSNGWLVGSGAVVAAAFIGFLPWNLRRPGMFLGDIGSYVLGASVIALSVAAIAVGVQPLAAVAPLVIYLADTGLTLLRRMVKRERWYEAHRTHVYQRLTDLGLSHLSVAAIVAVATAVEAAAGAASLVLRSDQRPWLVVVMVAIAIVYVLLPALVARLRALQNRFAS